MKLYIKRLQVSSEGQITDLKEKNLLMMEENDLQKEEIFRLREELDAIKCLFELNDKVSVDKGFFLVD